MLGTDRTILIVQIPLHRYWLYTDSLVKNCYRPKLDVHIILLQTGTVQSYYGFLKGSASQLNKLV